MNVPIESFRFGCTVQDDDHYLDVEFYDTSPKSLERIWRITRDNRTGAWYGTLLRADGEDEDFDHDIAMPKKLVSALAKKYLSAWPIPHALRDR